MKKAVPWFHRPHFCKNEDPTCENEAVCLFCHWNEENMKADEMDIRSGLLRLEPDENGILRYRTKK